MKQDEHSINVNALFPQLIAQQWQEQVCCRKPLDPDLLRKKWLGHKLVPCLSSCLASLLYSRSDCYYILHVDVLGDALKNSVL